MVLLLSFFGIGSLLTGSFWLCILLLLLNVVLFLLVFGDFVVVLVAVVVKRFTLVVLFEYNCVAA